jgi:hypothetical protein
MKVRENTTATDWNRFCVYCSKSIETREKFEKHIHDVHPGTYAENALNEGTL